MLWVCGAVYTHSVCIHLHRGFPLVYNSVLSSFFPHFFLHSPFLSSIPPQSALLWQQVYSSQCLWLTTMEQTVSPQFSYWMNVLPHVQCPLCVCTHIWAKLPSSLQPLIFLLLFLLCTLFQHMVSRACLEEVNKCPSVRRCLAKPSS